MTSGHRYPLASIAKANLAIGSLCFARRNSEQIYKRVWVEDIVKWW